jgi:hypothetical protein
VRWGTCRGRIPGWIFTFAGAAAFGFELLACFATIIILYKYTYNIHIFRK